MAAWKRKGGLQQYYDEMVDGMTSRGYEENFAKAIFEGIKGFSEYGFPESHETANGTIFISLEDESGNVQVVIWK